MKEPSITEALAKRRTSANGPSRHFAALQQFGRFLSEADINSSGQPLDVGLREDQQLGVHRPDHEAIALDLSKASSRRAAAFRIRARSCSSRRALSAGDMPSPCSSDSLMFGLEQGGAVHDHQGTDETLPLQMRRLRWVTSGSVESPLPVDLFGLAQLGLDLGVARRDGVRQALHATSSRPAAGRARRRSVRCSWESPPRVCRRR